MKQLSLAMFDVSKVIEERWSMPPEAVREAAEIVEQILLEGQTLVAFRDIVKRRMGITTDAIPEPLARQYADQLEAVTAERLSIKEEVEDNEQGGNYRVCIVDRQGRPALRGGAPFGFAARHSSAGVADDRAQFDMVTGRLEALLEREQVDPEKVIAVAGVMINAADRMKTLKLPLETPALPAATD